MNKRTRAIPYAARAKLPGAGIVSPHKRPPAGAKHWPKWTLQEAAQQGQREMFTADGSVNPGHTVVRQRRRKRRMGVFG